MSDRPRETSEALEAMRGLLRDPEVSAWLDEMRTLALLPVKRGSR
jgi:hypothetical protein